MSKHKHKIPGISAAEFSRRKFLKSAAGSSAVIAAAVTLPVQGASRGNKVNPKAKDPFEEMLRLYGSEFGDIRGSA